MSADVGVLRFTEVFRQSAVDERDTFAVESDAVAVRAESDAAVSQAVICPILELCIAVDTEYIAERYIEIYWFYFNAAAGLILKNIVPKVVIL